MNLIIERYNMSKLFSNKITYILIAFLTITLLFVNYNISYARQATAESQDENILEIPDFENEEDDDEINVTVEDETNTSPSYTSSNSSVSAESNSSSSATVSSLTLVPDDSLGISTIVSIILAVVGVVLVLLGIAILLKIGKK
jgi:beta-lactamase regulating signal transducer with metallopeptidase domain